MKTKEVEAAVEAIENSKRSGAEHTYWYCAKDDKGDPLFFADKKGSVIKAQVKQAKKDKRVNSGATKISGILTWDGGDSQYVLNVDNPSDQKDMDNAIDKILKKKLADPKLKQAFGNAVAKCADAPTTESTKIADLKSLRHSEWMSASSAGLFKPRSSSLKAVDAALLEWDTKCKDTVSGQVEQLQTLRKALASWIADKAGESIRLDAGKKLGRLLGQPYERMQAVEASLIEIRKVLKTDPKPTYAEEEPRLTKHIDIIHPYRNNQATAQTKAIGPEIVAVEQEIAHRLDPMKKVVRLEKERKVLAILTKVFLTEKTRKLIDSDANTKTITDAIFVDFFAYGKTKFTYNTSADSTTNILAGGSKGACATFAKGFADLVNFAVSSKTGGKKIAATKQISAKNFYTLPLSEMGFIDSSCPGNLVMDGESKPTRYFFSNHYIAVVDGAEYDPTTGRKGGAVASSVAEAGFEQAGSDDYAKGNKVIKVEKGKGYGGGALYRMSVSD